MLGIIKASGQTTPGQRNTDTKERTMKVTNIIGTINGKRVTMERCGEGVFVTIDGMGYTFMAGDANVERIARVTFRRCHGRDGDCVEIAALIVLVEQVA